MQLEGEWAEESSQGSKDTWARFPKLDWRHVLPSVLPRRTGMSSSRVNLQGEEEEVWMPVMRRTGSFSTQGKEYRILLPSSLRVWLICWEENNFIFLYLYLYLYLSVSKVELQCRLLGPSASLWLWCGEGSAPWVLLEGPCFVLSLSSSRWEPRVFSPNRKSEWRRGGAALQSAEVLYSPVT